jgi:CRISPR-associated protein Cmr2
MVLRTLRQAEKRAKNDGGRNAFSVALLKRSGGAVELTCPWFVNKETESLVASPMGLLIRLRDAFAGPGLSRRAAYLIQDWAAQLPGEGAMTDPVHHESMFATSISYQFRRQSKGEIAQKNNARLGRELARLARMAQGLSGRDNPAAFITDFLAVAEFLAREGRLGTKEEQGGSR